MWIKILALHNIQSFKEQRIEFSKGINILIGKNNTGKSTILRSLLNFQQGGNQSSTILIRKFEEESFVFALLEDNHFVSTLKKIHTNNKQAIFFNAKSGGYSWMHFLSEIPSNDSVLEFVKKLGMDGNSVDMQPYADVDPNNAFIPFLSKRKTPYMNGQFDDASMKKIDYDFRGLPTKVSKASSNTLASEFQKACKDILGFVPNVLPGQQSMNLATLGQYVGTDESVTLDNMGDGVAQVIGLLVNLFQAKNKIFVMEEIENDLHPDALKKLLALIVTASANNQFIISTHSNIVLRTLGAELDTKIFETRAQLETNAEARTSLFDSTIKELGNSPEERIRILKDLGYELADFYLHDGYLILEESSAEKLIREFMIPCFVPRLAGRLGIIAAKGAGDTFLRFCHLHSMFTYVHTSLMYKGKAWVLIDGGQAGEEAIKKLNTAFGKTWPSHHFKKLTRDDIEQYYPSEYSDPIGRISSEEDSKQKGKLKVDLAKRIVEEYSVNPKRVSEMFEKSADELIGILKEIEEEFFKP